MFSGTIDILMLQAREKGLEFGHKIDPDIPLLLQGDARRLRQVLINLIGNAIKFTPSGNVWVHIKNAGEDQRTVTLRVLVRDSGIGIAPDKLDQIFEPFIQADGSTTRKYGGSGLGLAICRQLTKLMGGDMGLESSEGKGSSFWFTVRLKKQMTPERALPPLHEPVCHAKKTTPAGDRLPLLLAEDDPISQKFMRAFLAKLGYVVNVVENGHEVLQALQEKEYALILMDGMMPGMNGYETTGVIRNLGPSVPYCNIPIIALTANTMKSDREKCLAAGMNDFLPKPLEIMALAAMLEKWLNSEEIQCS
jgi:CheY-like chemotaxis protein